MSRRTTPRPGGARRAGRAAPAGAHARTLRLGLVPVLDLVYYLEVQYSVVIMQPIGGMKSRVQLDIVRYSTYTWIYRTSGVRVHFSVPYSS